MLRVSIRGQSYVDGQEVPLRAVYDFDQGEQVFQELPNIFAAFLEEADFQITDKAIIATFEVEVVQLWQVR